MQGAKIGTIFKSFAIYTFFSAFALTVDTGVLSLSIRLFGISAINGVTLGYILGSASLYFLMHRFSNMTLSSTQIPLFIASGLLGLSVNQVVILSSSALLHTPPELAKIPASAASLLSNYALRTFLFKPALTANKENTP